MRPEQSLERRAKTWRLSRAFENFVNLFFMAVGHRRDDGLFVLEIPVDQTDADSSPGADIVHARLVKTAFGEARDRGIENLGWPVKNGVGLGLRHGGKTMNERSFIVKWPQIYETIWCFI